MEKSNLFWKMEMPSRVFPSSHVIQNPLYRLCERVPIEYKNKNFPKNGQEVNDNSHSRFFLLVVHDHNADFHYLNR